MASGKEGLSSKFGHWTALYAIYLFLAGWSYIRYYFTAFGVDAGWLDLGLNDTIAQGFSVLFGTGWLLSLVYLAVFLLSVIVEFFSDAHSRGVNTFTVCVLVILFPVTFFVARYAGVTQANKDRSGKTSLPTITFAVERCAYRGKVVYVKAEAIYVFNLAYLDTPAKSVTCPFDLAGASPDVPQLWLLRSSELKDIRIVHYQKEVKPW